MNPYLIPSPIKGFLGALAGLVLWGSDAAGIQHGTWFKSAATAVLIALGADVVTKNDRGARAATAVKKSLNGAER